MSTTVLGIILVLLMPYAAAPFTPLKLNVLVTKDTEETGVNVSKPISCVKFINKIKIINKNHKGPIRDTMKELPSTQPLTAVIFTVWVLNSPKYLNIEYIFALLFTLFIFCI